MSPYTAVTTHALVVVTLVGPPNKNRHTPHDGESSITQNPKTHLTYPTNFASQGTEVDMSDTRTGPASSVFLIPQHPSTSAASATVAIPAASSSATVGAAVVAISSYSRQGEPLLLSPNHTSNTHYTSKIYNDERIPYLEDSMLSSSNSSQELPPLCTGDKGPKPGYLYEARSSRGYIKGVYFTAAIPARAATSLPVSPGTTNARVLCEVVTGSSTLRHPLTISSQEASAHLPSLEGPSSSSSSGGTCVMVNIQSASVQVSRISVSRSPRRDRGT